MNKQEQLDVSVTDAQTPLDVQIVDEEGNAAPSPRRESAAQRLADRRADEKGLVSSGQRRVNMLWEVTQSLIAIAVTGMTLWVSGRVAIIAFERGDVDTSAFILLSNAFFLVIGFYFGRTNHQRTGGVGPEDLGR
ncbi:MAG TPA: hypothetical protein VK845_04840 [Gemmatimonadales bacterium]|nr:hypothetical protein [Gemmatimonadales bacterium]